MPLPNTALIHPDFSKHHQPSVNGSMRSTVDILLPLGEIPPANPFDPDPDGGDAAPDVALAGVPARIRALSHDSGIAPSGQSNSSQQYLIQIPAQAFIGLKVGANGHRIRVVTNTESPDIEGRTFSIDAVQHSSEAFNRDVVVSEHTTQQQGS